MTSLYALLRERCGLSLREAADLHGVSHDSVVSWSSGRRIPPTGVIAELRALYVRIENAADQIVAMADDVGPDLTIELGLASDDAEAKSIGWPCVGAQAAALGVGAALIDNPVTIVPRGSTAATAAAADRHDRRGSRRD